MTGIVAFMLFSQMYYMPNLVMETRNTVFYPKNKMINAKVAFISELFFLIIFFFVIGKGCFLKLAEQLEYDGIVMVYFIYAVLNVIVQLFLLKKEDRKINVAKCNYCKMIWMVGMVLHSLLIFAALLNQQNITVWMTGVTVFYGIYNYGFLFFIYFTEKEIFVTAWLESERRFSKAECVERLRPLCRVSNEEYRQRIIERVNWITGIGFITLATICVSGVCAVVMRYRDFGGSVWELIGTFPFLIGIIACLWYIIKMDRDTKRIRFDSIYEGAAQMVTPIPLTVRYRKPDGTMVARQAILKKKKMIPIGTFVKIVVENDKDVKISVENGEIARIMPGDSRYFSCHSLEKSGKHVKNDDVVTALSMAEKSTQKRVFEKKLSALHKVDEEEYRQCKIKEVRKRNGIVLLVFCLIAGAVTAAMLMVSKIQPMLFPLGLVCLGMLPVGIGRFTYFGAKAEKNLKNKRFEEVYEGVAQVIHAKPLIVRYLSVGGNEMTKRVDLQVPGVIPAGKFVKIVVENDKIVKVEEEK